MNNSAIERQVEPQDTIEGFNFSDPRFLEVIRLLLNGRLKPCEQMSNKEVIEDDETTKQVCTKILLRMKKNRYTKGQRQ